MNKLYYAITTRNGWCELHVSRNKKEVLELNALSRKIPVHSNLLEDFKIESKREMEQYRAVDVSVEVPIGLSSDGLKAAEMAYLHILKTPHDSLRMQGQSVLCALRDFIASATGRDIEDVQSEFENRAIEEMHNDLEKIVNRKK